MGLLRNLSPPIFLVKHIEERTVNYVPFSTSRGMVVRASKGPHPANAQVSARRIVLSWEHQPQDLDAHLLWRDSSTGMDRHIFHGKTYYAEDQSAWLDKDSMKGYGPESLTIEWMHATCYRVLVHAHSTEVCLGLS